MTPRAVTGNELRLVFVGVIGSPQNIEVHNHSLVVRIGPVMDELHSALCVIHDTATRLTKGTHPFRLTIVSGRREEFPRGQALDNEPHGS